MKIREWRSEIIWQYTSNESKINKQKDRFTKEEGQRKEKKCEMEIIAGMRGKGFWKNGKCTVIGKGYSKNGYE